MMKTISYLTRLQTRTEIFTIIKYKDIPIIVLTEHCLKKQFVTSTLCAGSILLLFWTFSFDEKSKHWHNRLKAEWNEDYCTLISTGDGLRKPISSTIFDFQIISGPLKSMIQMSNKNGKLCMMQTQKKQLLIWQRLLYLHQLRKQILLATRRVSTLTLRRWLI